MAYPPPPGQPSPPGGFPPHRPWPVPPGPATAPYGFPPAPTARTGPVPADPALRFLATTIDGAISMVLWVMCYLGGMLSFFFVGTRGWIPDNGTTIMIGVLVSLCLGFVAMFLHHWLFTARWGRTAGKFLTRIMVVDAATGRPPTMGNAAKRTLVRLAVQLVPFLQLVNALVALQDQPLIRTWHDKAAGTRVIGV